MEQVSLPVIGYIHSPLVEKFGIPRQPNLVDVPARIELLAPYDDARAFEGITAFSHVWLIWRFHHNKDALFRPQIRPPRLGGNAKIGVFASRSMYRPSALGLSVVQVERVEVGQGKAVLHVLGADLLHGTPIIDIKPYVAYADAWPNAHSGFAPDAPQRLPVQWSETASQQVGSLLAAGQLQAGQLPLIEQLLALDPRPAYQDDEREYGMAYDQVNVRFVVKSSAQGQQVSADGLSVVWIKEVWAR
jgi:tRNA-Thr(GGU) m(6)t(6)A37 methyltransferase TsaA